MPAYTVVVETDQVVTRGIKVLVEGSSPEEVEGKVRTLLQDYPEPTKYDVAIHRVVTTKAKYWIPKSVKIVSIEEERNDNEAA